MLTAPRQIQFLLRIIGYLKDEGKSIDWQRVHMNGRSTKSLKNQWTKVAKEIAEIKSGEGDAAVAAAPRAKATREGTPPPCVPPSL